MLFRSPPLRPPATATSSFDGRSGTGPYATVGIPTASQLASNGLTATAIRNPLTGATESEAQDLKEVIQEMLLATTSERQGRLIDSDQAGSMEQKKREGYF